MCQEHVHIQRHPRLARKSHFGHASEQAAIAAIVVGQDVGAQGVDSRDQIFQIIGAAQIRDFLALLLQALRQHAARQAVFAMTQIDQNQTRVFGLQLRRQGAAHIVERDKAADDARHGRDHFLLRPTLPLPLRPHRERIFAHRYADVERGAQLHAHGFHRLVQRRVFAWLAASGHPVSAEFDFLKRHRGSQ